MKKVLIIGGGYGGLSCAIQLARSEKFAITLVDQRPYFLNLLQLHRTHFLALDRLQTDFQLIARKWGLEFIQGEAIWNEAGHLPLAIQLYDPVQKRTSSAREARLSCDQFDFIIIATGARTSVQSADFQNGIALEQLTRKSLKEYLEPLFVQSRQPVISVVGAGPTGIQYLFDIEGYLKRNKLQAQLRLINAEKKLLSNFSGGFHRYAMSRAKEKKIEVLNDSPVQFIASDHVVVQDGKKSTTQARQLPSDLTLWFQGVRAEPASMQVDEYGRLLDIESSDAARYFSVGDCSVYAGRGMNEMTAQSAVRKGKLVADNLIALESGDAMQAYRYQALGYFISLGSWDGIGWMLARINVLRGLSALVVKEAIEAQFKLYLEGIDTYIG